MTLPGGQSSISKSPSGLTISYNRGEGLPVLGYLYSPRSGVGYVANHH